MRQPIFETAATARPRTSEGSAYALAGAAGLLAALLGGVGWIVATEVTGLEIGYVAIGAAWLVGMSIRQFKASDANGYGYLSAALSLLAIVAGDAGTVVAAWSTHDHIDFFAELRTVATGDLLNAMVRSSDLMTIVFYVIAIIAGYRVAMGHRTATGNGPPRATA
jgi:hypothetical protein